MILKPSGIPELELDSMARDELKAFLNTETCRRAFAILAARAPSLLSSGDPHDVVNASGQRLGYEKCLEELVSLTVPIHRDDLKSNVTEAYPDIEDDSKFEGEKLKET